MNLVIFAPVTQREWILPHYFNHLREQTGIDLSRVMLMFLYGESSDAPRDRTLELLRQEREGPWFDVQIRIDREHRHQSKRQWNMPRWRDMADMRNRLLRSVRDAKPDYALSLDTDILLPPNAISTLLEEMAVIGADGISPLTFMTPGGERHPNAMDLEGENRVKIQPETFIVPACFAAVLMNDRLYQIDYAPHPAGEDLGWANNVADAGLSLALCPSVRAKHVMTKEMVGSVDPRVGF